MDNKIDNIDVKLVNVTKKFGNFTAVNRVSLEVPKGSFFSILGPSGSGKTTLLRIISGFEYPDSGDIFIGGERVNDLPPNRRRTNLVFQNLALFPTMNVAKNIAFGLRRLHLPKDEIWKRVEHIIEIVELKGLENRKMDMLSGGQCQRVALARCLVLEPTVLLLDEPLGALDLKLRESMKLVLKRLQARVGTTFIYVTHDQSEALTMSNLVAVMNRGKLEQISPPLELFYNPKTYFVAKFIGDNNCWNGFVRSVAGSKCKVKMGKFEILVDKGEELKPGDNVSVFLRPEVIRIISDRESGNLKGRIKEFVFDGAYFRILVEVALDNFSLEVKVKIPQSEEIPRVKLGDIVKLKWPYGAGVAFRRSEEIKRDNDETLEGAA